MSVELQWGLPPGRPVANYRGRTQGFVALLKERPGEWAVYPYAVGRGTSSSIYAKVHVGTQWCRRGEHLYARWIGLNGEYK